MTGLMLAAMLANRPAEAWAVELDSPNWRTRERADRALRTHDVGGMVTAAVTKSGRPEAVARARAILADAPAEAMFVFSYEWVETVKEGSFRFPLARHSIALPATGRGVGDVTVWYAGSAVYAGPWDEKAIRSAMRRVTRND